MFLKKEMLIMIWILAGLFLLGIILLLVLDFTNKKE